MYPATIAFKDELGKLDATLLLHLPYEVKQLAVLRFRAIFCCSLAMSRSWRRAAMFLAAGMAEYFFMCV